jgi:hypothetical protein
MGALRDLVGLVRWSRAQPRPSLGDALATAARATEDARAYQGALVSGVVGPESGVAGTALVESAQVLPVTGDGPARTAFVLMLDVPGHAPVRVSHTEVAPRVVSAGERLVVWAVTFDPRRFTIDWAGS